MKGLLASALVALVVDLAVITPAQAEERCDRGTCVGSLPTEAGFGVGISVGGGPVGAEGGGGGGGSSSGPLYTYAYVPACSSNGPPPGNADLCLAATTSCADGGVRLWVFRREVDRDTRAPLTGWDRLDGTICMDATADGAPAIARLPA
ncbi:MAG TPA: hypothetical protein VNA12_07445, partial [Mycobacteriales bacterium]|nr:hypothetical protein [Mycobacteriales bacterium]